MNAPNSKTPMPGAIRRTIGEVEVTALLDGFMEVTPALFGVSDDQAAASSRGVFQSAPYLSPVNSFLLDLGGRVVLIDTGARDLFVPTLGNLPAAMAASGYAAEDIDVVLLTHMHPDHIGGSIRPDGTAAFPNAELFVSEAEIGFWCDDGRMASAPIEAKPVFDTAKAVAGAYAGRTTKFGPDASLFGSLEAFPLPGHTPGHTGFILNSGTDSLFIWADTVHHAAFQMEHPEWALAYDVDPELAVASRKRALDMAAADRMRVAGMHLPFPAMGHVAREKVGFRYQPSEWPYLG